MQLFDMYVRIFNFVETHLSTNYLQVQTFYIIKIGIFFCYCLWLNQYSIFVIRHTNTGPTWGFVSHYIAYMSTFLSRVTYTKANTSFIYVRKLQVSICLHLWCVREFLAYRFLHMMLSSNQPSLEYIVKLIHSVKQTHLLNKTNNNAQSILHLAIIHDLPHLVTFLVSKGKPYI